jgi:hypothetical protein
MQTGLGAINVPLSQFYEYLNYNRNAGLTRQAYVAILGQSKLRAGLGNADRKGNHLTAAYFFRRVRK